MTAAHVAEPLKRYARSIAPADRQMGTYRCVCNCIEDARFGELASDCDDLFQRETVAPGWPARVIQSLSQHLVLQLGQQKAHLVQAIETLQKRR